VLVLVVSVLVGGATISSGSMMSSVGASGSITSSMTSFAISSTVSSVSPSPQLRRLNHSSPSKSPSKQYLVCFSQVELYTSMSVSCGISIALRSQLFGVVSVHFWF